MKQENNKVDIFDKMEGVVRIKIEIRIELIGQQAHKR